MKRTDYLLHRNNLCRYCGLRPAKHLFCSGTCKKLHNLQETSMKKDNLTSVIICNKKGEPVERVELRVNRKNFYPGARFQGIRNKISMPKVKLEFVSLDHEGNIIATKVK